LIQTEETEPGNLSLSFKDLKGEVLYNDKGDKINSLKDFTDWFLAQPENRNLVKSNLKPGANTLNDKQTGDSIDLDKALKDPVEYAKIRDKVQDTKLNTNVN